MTPELDDYCGRLTESFWHAIELLSDYDAKGEIKERLRCWAIVLGVLALDVFESVVVLLENDKRRGGSMLARALVDYDIRLRYYIVQALPLAKSHEHHPDIESKHFLERVRAVTDWENADASLLLGVVRRYGNEIIGEKARRALEVLIARNEHRKGQSFTDMHKYLQDNEASIRGLIPGLAGPFEGDYASLKPNWHMQSAFLHGDQAVITDVLEYHEDGRRKPIHRYSPVSGVKATVFTAISHMNRMMTSFGMILSYVPNAMSLTGEVGPLWFATPPDVIDSE